MTSVHTYTIVFSNFHALQSESRLSAYIECNLIQTLIERVDLLKANKSIRYVEPLMPTLPF